MAVLSYQKRVMSEQVLDNVAFVSEDYSMDENDYTVIVDASGGNVTVTLPYAVEAKGRFYAVIAADTNSGANTVTVADRNDGLVPLSDIALTTDGSEAVVYSDGVMWHQLKPLS